MKKFFNELDSLFKDFGSLFTDMDTTFTHSLREMRNGAAALDERFKISTTPKEATITADLPGVLIEDVKVYWEGEALFVVAVDRRKNREKTTKQRFYFHGDNREKTTATLRSGVLTIVIPRTVVGKAVIEVPVQP